MAEWMPSPQKQQKLMISLLETTSLKLGEFVHAIAVA
jgi:hypothetical protein